MKRVLLVLGILLSSLSVFANDNVLQSIEIEPVKDTYNIVLVSDKAVDVKKSVQASNKITLTMKDIRASKTLNTIYNNVSNVDTVMVEPQGNGIKIFFQADNAAASTITFDALVASAPAKGAGRTPLYFLIKSQLIRFLSALVSAPFAFTLACSTISSATSSVATPVISSLLAQKEQRRVRFAAIACSTVRQRKPGQSAEILQPPTTSGWHPKFASTKVSPPSRSNRRICTR